MTSKAHVEFDPMMMGVRLAVIRDAGDRAIYEALTDYFGHTGHDVRALRKDYDAERGRVDKLIAHLTGRAS